MSRRRLLFTTIIIFLLVGAGVVWILSILSIIQNSWSIPLGTGFSVLGVLGAFFQWMYPLPFAESKTPPTAPASVQARETFLKQISTQLTEDYGALVVYEKKANVGKNMQLFGGSGGPTGLKANIVERMVNDQALFVAIFPVLRPGNYQASGPSTDTFISYTPQMEVTVFPRNVAELEWSDRVKKEKKRRRFFFNLRASSTMIGFGGLLLLIYIYIEMIPNLDNISIALMSIGVVWLFLTLLFALLG